MIESYCLRIENFELKEQTDILEENELNHFLSQIIIELSVILDMPFVQFWAYFVKNKYAIEFLDALLMNMRKNNDIYKLQV